MISLQGFSQEYMDKIAQQTCTCMKNLSDTVSTQRMYMELGLCMISAAEPYKKQLKKDYGIDLNGIDSGDEGEKLGKQVGFKMASICPDALIAMTSKVENDNSAKNKTNDDELFSGRVTKIEKDFFVIFTITDTENKSIKFHWLSYAESNIELINNYNSLFDKDVKVKYYLKELFDPKIGEYRNFNIISKIEQLSR